MEPGGRWESYVGVTRIRLRGKEAEGVLGSDFLLEEEGRLPAEGLGRVRQVCDSLGEPHERPVCAGACSFLY